MQVFNNAIRHKDHFCLSTWCKYCSNLRQVLE